MGLVKLGSQVAPAPGTLQYPTSPVTVPQAPLTSLTQNQNKDAEAEMDPHLDVVVFARTDP